MHWLVRLPICFVFAALPQIALAWPPGEVDRWEEAVRAAFYDVVPTREEKISGWLRIADSLVPETEISPPLEQVRRFRWLAYPEMARDLRLAVATIENDPDARRAALVEHEKYLRWEFASLSAAAKQDDDWSNKAHLAFVGERLAHTCADLAELDRRRNDQRSCLETRLAWAERLREAMIGRYETEPSLIDDLELKDADLRARADLNRFVGDRNGQLVSLRELEMRARLTFAKIDTLHHEAARGGEDSALARAHRRIFVIRAEIAALRGDRAAQLAALEEAALRSREYVQHLFKDYGRQVADEIAIVAALADLAKDRLELGRVSRNESAAQFARTEYLVQTTTLLGHICRQRIERPDRFEFWDAMLVEGAAGLAEMAVWPK